MIFYSEYFCDLCAVSIQTGFFHGTGLAVGLGIGALAEVAKQSLKVEDRTGKFVFFLICIMTFL